ncbi:hypothetical protein HXX02_06880 [Microbulbifer elongatus]|uniref:Organic solvent tolerance-like N-terminal domain-containing protein n=1 Tax=Microbulbifer elongatus TaxID=86173 RepID=A0ABT1NZ44_9GAMM|nr:hypothetical protein [Microbulbifer elongatus]MCQ3829164.1 hypothetical protein [Microbulbifer elongatus]
MKSVFNFIFVSIVAIFSVSAWSLEITADEVRGQHGSDTKIYLGNVNITFPEGSGLETTALTVKNLSSGERILEGDVTLKYESLVVKSEKVILSPIEGGLVAAMEKAAVSGS